MEGEEGWKSYCKQGPMSRDAEGGRAQISPGPPAPRGLITPNTLRSGGPHKVNPQYFSKINF